MRYKSKLTKLWERISPLEKPRTVIKKVSLSFPDDAQQGGSTLIPVIGNSYNNETIIIDGRNFINCEFNECTIFNGIQKLVSPVPQVAGAMQLANVCGLLNENTKSSEFDTGSKATW